MVHFLGHIVGLFVLLNELYLDCWTFLDLVDWLTVVFFSASNVPLFYSLYISALCISVLLLCILCFVFCSSMQWVALCSSLLCFLSVFLFTVKIIIWTTVLCLTFAVCSKHCNDFCSDHKLYSVSYTHLTLPTKRIV